MSIAATTFELRPSTSADHDAIADIWHASASLPTVGPPIMPTRDDLRERVDQQFSAGWVVTVAVRGDEIVGFVATKPPLGILDQLFLRPESRGSGGGRALLDHAKRTMPDGFTLYTRSANTKARRFYETAGLVALRDDVHPRTGDPVTYYGWAGR